MPKKCTNAKCGREAKMLHFVSRNIQVCDVCLSKWVWTTRRAVKKNRPTSKQVFAVFNGLLNDYINPLTERVASLERENAALREAIQKVETVRIAPKTKSAMAREMLESGMKSAEVAAKMGWPISNVRKVKHRMLQGQSSSEPLDAAA